MTTETEVWVTCKGHPLYEVSSYGRVRSYNNNRWGRRQTPKILSIKNWGRYKGVCLGKGKVYQLHRLVCENFHPNPDNLPVVLHLDNNPYNNHKDNLCWGTQKENIHQCIREGRRGRNKKT